MGWFYDVTKLAAKIEYKAPLEQKKIKKRKTPMETTQRCLFK